MAVIERPHTLEVEEQRRITAEFSSSVFYEIQNFVQCHKSFNWSFNNGISEFKIATEDDIRLQQEVFPPFLSPPLPELADKIWKSVQTNNLI